MKARGESLKEKEKLGNIAFDNLGMSISRRERRCTGARPADFVLSFNLFVSSRIKVTYSGELFLEANLES